MPARLTASSITGFVMLACRDSVGRAACRSFADGFGAAAGGVDKAIILYVAALGIGIATG